MTSLDDTIEFSDVFKWSMFMILFQMLQLIYCNIVYIIYTCTSQLSHQLALYLFPMICCFLYRVGKILLGLRLHRNTSFRCTGRIRCIGEWKPCPQFVFLFLFHGWLDQQERRTRRKRYSAMLIILLSSISVSAFHILVHVLYLPVNVLYLQVHVLYLPVHCLIYRW